MLCQNWSPGDVLKKSSPENFAKLQNTETPLLESLSNNVDCRPSVR